MTTLQSDRLFRFFQWNDLHVRSRDREAGYPNCNEKAGWAVRCARGLEAVAPPDFIVSAGDIICGESDRMDGEFEYLRTHVTGLLDVPFLPCVGNHENGQGEGLAANNAAYDRCFGPRWHNYFYTVGGLAFLVIDSSGGHRTPDEVTAARNVFVQRAFTKLGRTPTIVVTHIPLVPMREEKVLAESFGFNSWRNQDPALLRLIEGHADTVIAVLSGHLHLTGVHRRGGIHHIVPSGTAGYPADFASFDVYPDRIAVEMHRAPDTLWGDTAAGDIHGRTRHPINFTDTDHPDHEHYLSGNPDERSFVILHDNLKRLHSANSTSVTVFHETKPDHWQAIPWGKTNGTGAAVICSAGGIGAPALEQQPTLRSCR